MVDLNAKYIPDPEKEGGNLAKKLRKDKGRPDPDSGDFVNQLGEAFTKFVRLSPDSPREDRSKLVKNLKGYPGLIPWTIADMPEVPSDITNDHLAVNPGTKWVSRRENVQKGGKAEVACRIRKDIVKMEGDLRLLKKGSRCNNVREHTFDDGWAREQEVGRMINERKLQMNVTRKAEPSTLKVRLLRLTRKRRLSQKRGAPTKKGLGPFGGPDEEPYRAIACSKPPEKDWITKVTKNDVIMKGPEAE